MFYTLDGSHGHNYITLRENGASLLLIIRVATDVEYFGERKYLLG